MSDAINIIMAIGMVSAVFIVRGAAQENHTGAFYEPPAQQESVIARYASAEPAAPPTLADAQAVSETNHSKKHHGNLTVLQILEGKF